MLFSLLVNLCYIFYRLRTVFSRARLHQLMILYFFIKTSYFSYFLTTFVMFVDMMSKESHVSIYILDILKIGDILYIEKWASQEKESVTQCMPFAIPGKYSAGCLGNYIFETIQRNCKKPLPLSFTVETFHQAPPLEGRVRGTNSKVWRIFLVFGNFG